MVEFAEELLFTFFKLFMGIMVLFFSLMGYILYHKLISGKAILGWASTTAIGLLNLALLSFGFFILGVLILKVAGNRSSTTKKIYQIIQRDGSPK